MACSFSPSNLICNEDTTHPNEEEEPEVYILFSETEDEYIEALVSRESSFESRASGVSDAESVLRCARLDSIKWVLKMKACFGFGYQTAYLTMTYFDRFLVRRSIDEDKTWAWKLLSVACLSLAAKMEECMPPALSEYQLEVYQFSSNVIQRMELLVLNTLQWRMCSVTPFAYLGYFASKLECESGRKDLFSRAIGFIFAIIEALNLVDCRPSAMAAAAILAASSDSMMIQESQKQKPKPSKHLISSDVSANCASANTSVDLNNDTSISATSNKRRRLQ